MDVIPADNLNPESKPWARAITKAVSDYISQKSNQNTKQNNTLLGLNATVNKLQQQVQQLSSFKTYSVVDSNQHNLTVYNSLQQLSTMNLSFTLTRTSTVLINAFATFTGEAIQTTTNPSANVTFTNDMQVTFPPVAGLGGALFGYSQRANYSTAISPLASTRLDISASATVGTPLVLTIPAGLVNIQSYPSAYLLANSGTAYVSNASIIATVIG